jgi:DNA-binding transcriptional regulator YiaG
MNGGGEQVEKVRPISGGFIDPQAPLERRIRELEAQVAALEAARMPHVPEGVDPVIRALVTERVRRGMSQRDVVHILDCSSASVSQWERGVTSPTLTKLRAWAEALGMSLDVTVTPPGEPR